MLHLLSSLFSSSGEKTDELDKVLIEAAIERALEGTDRRLLGVGSCRKRLRPAVEIALRHIKYLVDKIPGAVEISRDAYRHEPPLKAFFASPAHMQEVIGGFSAVRDYLKHMDGSPPEEIFGCLSMACKEKKTLGMEFKSEMLQREVAQVSVSFYDHRYVGPSANEAQCRRELQNRGFDFLLEKALERIVTAKSRRTGLEQQRRILNRKLEAMKSGNWGLESMLGEKPIEHPDMGKLESEIDELDKQLVQLGAVPNDLEESIQVLCDILGKAPEWLAIEEISMNLDSMLVKKDTVDGGEAVPLRLTQVRAESGERRIILLGRFASRELPEKPDFFKQAARYLG